MCERCGETNGEGCNPLNSIFGSAEAALGQDMYQQQVNDRKVQTESTAKFLNAKSGFWSALSLFVMAASLGIFLLSIGLFIHLVWG